MALRNPPPSGANQRNKMMTYKQALAKYKSGKWSMEVPPVQTSLWDDEAWVYWIFKIKPENKEVA